MGAEGRCTKHLGSLLVTAAPPGEASSSAGSLTTESHGTSQPMRTSGRRIPTFAANGNLGAISLIQTTPTQSFSRSGPLNNASASKHWQTTKMPAVTVFRCSLKVDFCPFFYKNISTAMSLRLWPQKMHRWWYIATPSKGGDTGLNWEVAKKAIVRTIFIYNLQVLKKRLLKFYSPIMNINRVVALKVLTIFAYIPKISDSSFENTVVRHLACVLRKCLGTRDCWSFMCKACNLASRLFAFTQNFKFLFHFFIAQLTCYEYWISIGCKVSKNGVIENLFATLHSLYIVVSTHMLILIFWLAIFFLLLANNRQIFLIILRSNWPAAKVIAYLKSGQKLSNAVKFH